MIVTIQNPIRPINIMMSGSKAPDFDAYGLFRAMHAHFSTPLRSVLDMCHWHIAPYPLFAYFYAHIGAGPKDFDSPMSKLMWV